MRMLRSGRRGAGPLARLTPGACRRECLRGQECLRGLPAGSDRFKCLRGLPAGSDRFKCLRGLPAGSDRFRIYFSARVPVPAGSDGFRIYFSARVPAGSDGFRIYFSAREVGSACGVCLRGQTDLEFTSLPARSGLAVRPSKNLLPGGFGVWGLGGPAAVPGFLRVSACGVRRI